MQKLGFSLQTQYNMPMKAVLRLLRDIGFCAVSPLWQPDVPTEEVANDAARYGLVFQSLHGSYRGLTGMWSPIEECFSPILQDLLASVDDCAALDIPVLVVHTWGGSDYTFCKDTLHFQNFDTLVAHARAKGVKIAFENLESPEYLAALMARYPDPEMVGYCWDNGHELCYTPTQDYLAIYGDRLFMTHLNDNYGITHPHGKLQGTDDLHLLAYDGIADWSASMKRLKKAAAQEILNFELKIRPKGNRCKVDLYGSMPLEQYFTKAYETASRVAAEYFK